MMFIVRSSGDRPDAAAVAVKLARRTPDLVTGAAGNTDFFCVGDGEAMAALRAAGWNVVELRDGYYHDDSGGGVAIWGQGRYWEIREEPLTVKEAVGPARKAADPTEGEHVEVRRAIFGA